MIGFMEWDWREANKEGRVDRREREGREREKRGRYKTGKKLLRRNYIGEITLKEEKEGLDWNTRLWDKYYSLLNSLFTRVQ